MFLQPSYSRFISQFVNGCNKKKEKFASFLSMKINDEADALYSVEKCFSTFLKGITLENLSGDKP